MCSCQKKYSNEPFLGNLSSAAAAAAAKTDFFSGEKNGLLGPDDFYKNGIQNYCSFKALKL